MSERWLPVPGYLNYAVSDQGRVWSFNVGRAMSVKSNTRKYLSVILCRDRSRRTARVNRLILGTFIGPCPDGMECAHLNGDSRDNRLVNLAWVTPEENYRQRDEHGTTARGSDVGTSVLTEHHVQEIRRTYRRGVLGFGCRALARRFGVHRKTIRTIVNGNSWRHVS